VVLGLSCLLYGSLSCHIQNRFVAHKASYPLGAGNSFLRGNVAGAWSWPHSSARCLGKAYEKPYPDSIICLYAVVIRHRDLLAVVTQTHKNLDFFMPSDFSGFCLSSMDEGQIGDDSLCLMAMLRWWGHAVCEPGVILGPAVLALWGTGKAHCHLQTQDLWWEACALPPDLQVLTFW
jgi:hypothetical protein